jgi:hypothetical protein
MARYRLKVPRVDAVQWDGDGFDNPPTWVVDAFKHGRSASTVGVLQRVDRQLSLGTVDGIEIASPGCWIVRLPDGTLRCMKSTLFNALFEVINA